MVTAIRSNNEGSMSVQDAEARFHFPKTMINDRTNGRRSGTDAHAHEMTLTKKQEEELAIG